MPRRSEFAPALLALIAAQDGVIAAWQLAQHGIGPWPAQHRVENGQWQRLLPGVLLTNSGELTRRQRVIAAHLWAGDDAAIDGASACHYFGLLLPRFEPSRVHIAAPLGKTSARSRDWVRVRRTMAEMDVVHSDRLAYVAQPIALLVAAREGRTKAEAVAILSKGLQKGFTTVKELQAAREMLGDKWCKRLDQALADVGVGLRSPAEVLLRDLGQTSRVLPEPRWNQWLDLGDGGCPICADALWIEAGMLHEVNGKAYHAWGDAYETTSARAERITAVNLVHTQSTPLRLVREGALVIANLERTYLQNVGRGMPAGVRLIDPPAWAA